MLGVVAVRHAGPVASGNMVCIDKNTVAFQTFCGRITPLPRAPVSVHQGGKMNPFILRGVLTGASLGVFAALFGIVDNMPRAFLIGFAAGGLAGLTMARLRRNKPPVD